MTYLSTPLTHNAFTLGTTGGNMIAIENADDFEFYSSNSAGAIQGAGYQCRNAGCVGFFVEGS